MPDRPSPDEASARALERVYDTLKTILEKSERAAASPARKLLARLGLGGSSGELDALMGQALEALGQARLTEWRAEYRDLEARQAELEAARDAQRRAALTAPERGLFRPTRGRIEADLERVDEDLAQIGRDKATAVAQMQAEFARSGLSVSPEQVRSFLVSATGDAMLELYAAFQNVRGVTEQLAGLYAQPGRSTATARQYYGMYVVMLRVLMTGHDKLLEKIAQVYGPRLESIQDEVRATRAKTRELLRAAGTPEGERVLRANLAAQDRTEEAAAGYLKFIHAQEARLTRTRARLAARHEVADNTYQTVRVAADLADMVRSSLSELAALSEMEPPELLPFGDAEGEQHILELTRRITEGGA